MGQNVSVPQAVPASDHGSIGVRQPRASFTLCIGVTGHRLNKLRAADIDLLRVQISATLQFIKNVASNLLSETAARFSSEPPVLRVISPIAEGSDRFVAEEGLALGFELHCPLPFPREEYERDFETEESRTQFHQLLARATAVVELDGGRDAPDAAAHDGESYEVVGRMVLNQSDVLIAIWDGKPGEPGGTGYIEAEAETLGVPIVWVFASSPHPISVKTKRTAAWICWSDGGSDSLLTTIKDAAKEDAQ
jgi:hypothetical protein